MSHAGSTSASPAPVPSAGDGERADEGLANAGMTPGNLRPVRIHAGAPDWPVQIRQSCAQRRHSGFLSNFHVSRLCSNSVRTRAARAMGPISLGLAVTFWSVFHRWESSAKPLPPRHLAELSSIFLVRTLMSGSFTPVGFFTGGEDAVTCA